MLEGVALNTTHLIVDEMRPADAYALGFADALQAQTSIEESEAASKAHVSLTAILDRIENIAPYEFPPRDHVAYENEAIAVGNGEWKPL